MTNIKTTKKALIASALSLLLCVSMLVGSTFAWFTDSVTTGVNTIQSGKLDVVLEMWDGKNWVDAEGETLEFVKGAMAAEDEAVLWEPGCTYNLPKLRISNAGNLALKFDVVITGIGGDAKLNEVIEWKYDYTADMVYGADSSVLEEGPISKHGNGYPLVPADKADGISGVNHIYLSISGHMDENAGNEYQGLTIDGISITVLATQYTYESDSNNPMYDFSAQYPEAPIVVTNQDELNAEIAKATAPTNLYLTAGTYTLPALTNKTVTISGSQKTVIDTTAGFQSTNGADITFDGVTVKFANANYKGFTHAAKLVYKNCTIIGQQTMYAPAPEFINCTFEVEGDIYAVWTYGTNATFTDCTFNCDGKAVLVYTEGDVTAEVTFNGCTFNDNGDISNKAAIEVGESANGKQANYTINVNDCTVNGFDVTAQNAATYGGTNLGTTVWGNKNLIPADRLDIVINGTEAY